jgi:signal transduction histidine kinase
VGKRQGARTAAEVVDVGELLHSLRKSLPGIWPQFADGSLGLELNTARNLYVNGVRGELMEVFLNIAKNAVEAMPSGGRLIIKGAVKNGTVLIDCNDTGPGVSQDALARLFDPFFSTKGWLAKVWA